MDVGAWLNSIGLDRYARAFEENEIDAALLPSLTADDLKELGVTLVGHRRRLLDAIAGLGDPAALARRPDPRPPATGAEPASEASDGERRQLTLMFVDLVNSTDLSRRLDPEEMREVIRAYQNAVAGEITRYEGHVAKFMGDGVLAYFGWPKAHENEAERAVRSGLAISDAVGALVTATGETLSARVGIATGLVVVGDLVGEGAAQEQAVIGETPNLAARLQQAARPGDVVIGETTARLVSGMFEVTEPDDIELKGFDGNTTIYRVVGESAVESRFEALHDKWLSPIIGRDQELALMQERWKRAKIGDGQLLQLIGEPGIGKSRIVQALLDELQNEDYFRIRYYCSPYHENSVLYPVIDHLRRSAEIGRDDPESEKLDKLESVLLHDNGDRTADVVAVAALLDLSTDDRYPPLDLTPQRQKALTFEALLRQVEALASRKPVAIVLEDMQWLDPTSMELFNLLADHIDDLPVMLVTTFRPELAPPWLGYPHATVLTLNRLSRAQTREIVEEMTQNRRLPESVMTQVLERTDGVPLFIEELTKVVLESEIPEDDGESAEQSGRPPSLSIPSTLNDSLMARLDRLARVKELAQLTAALGRSFSYELIAAVSSLSGSDLDEALDQLVSSDLMVRRGIPPKATFTFRHALMQDAAYESMLRSKRQLLHARIAKALVEGFPDTVRSQPEVLANHYSQAGDFEQAVKYYKAAGQIAMTRSATVEAISQLEAGLRDLRELGESDARDRQELEIQLAIGSAMVAAHGFAARDTGTAYQRSRTLCENLGDKAALFPVLYGICLYHLYAADLASAAAASQRLLELARDEDDRGLRFFAHRAAGVTAYPAGNFGTAREHLEQALMLYRRDELDAPAFVYAFDPRVVCLDYLSRTLLALGCVEDALRLSDEATEEARRIGHYNSLALPLFFGATIQQICGNADCVKARAGELIDLARDHGFRFWEAGGRILDAWTELEAGRGDDGLDVLIQAVEDWRSTGAEFMVPYFLVLVARGLSSSGDPAEARKLLSEAVERIDRSGERWYEAEVYRALGDLALDEPSADAGGAEAHYRRALAVAREQHARLWQLRAAASLVRLHPMGKSREDAEKDLAEIVNQFEPNVEFADLASARSLLEPGRP